MQSSAFKAELTTAGIANGLHERCDAAKNGDWLWLQYHEADVPICLNNAMPFACMLPRQEGCRWVTGQLS